MKFRIRDFQFKKRLDQSFQTHHLKIS